MAKSSDFSNISHWLWFQSVVFYFNLFSSNWTNHLEKRSYTDNSFFLQKIHIHRQMRFKVSSRKHNPARFLHFKMLCLIFRFGDCANVVIVENLHARSFGLLLARKLWVKARESTDLAILQNLDSEFRRTCSDYLRLIR